MSTKRRIENLEYIVSQLALKMFGPSVYLNRPMSDRLDEQEVGLEIMEKRYDVLESELAELIEEVRLDKTD
jgi:hypothetical protein